MLFEPEVNEIAAHRRSVVRHHVMIVAVGSFSPVCGDGTLLWVARPRCDAGVLRRAFGDPLPDVLSRTDFELQLS